MQNKNIIKLLDLQGINIKDVKRTKNIVYISIEMNKKIPSCPRCGSAKSHIHDYRTQEIKDIASFGYKTILVLKKRRYRCVNCSKRHSEEIPFLGKYQRMTMRLILFIAEKLKEQRSLKNIGKEIGVSHTPIYSILKSIGVGISELPKVLSINEFKGSSSGHKYHLSIVDGEKRKILDILSNRTKDNIENYFRSFSYEERKKVKYFITDMYLPYKNLIDLFPEATLIIDKYHYIRQITWGFKAVRRRVQKSMKPELRKYFKRSKSLLSRPAFKLSKEDKIKVDTMLWYSEELRDAYLIKEKYYNEFLKSEDITKAKKNLSSWIYLTEKSQIKEYKDALRSHINWRTGILNSFTVPYTNGPTEGFNNKIKVLKRLSYGFRNFENFRKRILNLA